LATRIFDLTSAIFTSAIFTSRDREEAVFCGAANSRSALENHALRESLSHPGARRAITGLAIGRRAFARGAKFPRAQLKFDVGAYLDYFYNIAILCQSPAQSFGLLETFS
jgi:uncharacterized protein YjbI with pentapeptide repeats